MTDSNEKTGVFYCNKEHLSTVFIEIENSLLALLVHIYVQNL